MTDVDTTAADVLEELDEALNAQGISLVFAELKDPVRRKIERYGLTRTIDPRHFFPTIEAAVAAFRHGRPGPSGPLPTSPGQTRAGAARHPASFRWLDGGKRTSSRTNDPSGDHVLSIIWQLSLPPPPRTRQV